jgi:hypothetical protein
VLLMPHAVLLLSGTSRGNRRATAAGTEGMSTRILGQGDAHSFFVVPSRLLARALRYW